MRARDPAAALDDRALAGWRSWVAPHPLACALLVAIGLAVVGLVAIKAAGRISFELAAWQGVRLNRAAWEASFTERGMAVPPTGPRDGYWGARLGKHTPHPVLGWVLPELHVPGLVEVDALGMQHVRAGVPVAARLLILGGSAGFGAYASAIETTYFHRLAVRLARDALPVDVTVYAAGAWKSVQEIRALEFNGLSTRPDVVVFLDGLNDLTNGANAQALYGVQTRTLDGSRWHPLYHEHDYAERLALYLGHMRRAGDLLRARGIAVVFAPQPALFEKVSLSAVEEEVLRRALDPHRSRAALQDAYASLRGRLAELASGEGTHFVDCSRAFDGEGATVFTDLWHFSDVGHRLLADCLAAGLAPVVRARGHAWRQARELRMNEGRPGHSADSDAAIREACGGPRISGTGGAGRS